MPYRDFTVGQILTSQEVDDYLMRQAVMVFDDSATRGTAIGTAVSEGMVTFLKDSDSLEQYNGTAWVRISTIGEKGQQLISNGTAGVVYENSISPLLLLGV